MSNLVTVLTHVRAAQSWGVCWFAYGALIADAGLLYRGLRVPHVLVPPTVSEVENPPEGPRCVACAAPITAETRTGPQCGWTQPG